MENYTSYLGNSALFDPRFTGPLILLLAWTLFWKGWALWLSARRGEKPWFVILLVLNTLGILEIIYIFAVAKQSDKKTETASPAEMK